MVIKNRLAPSPEGPKQGGPWERGKQTWLASSLRGRSNELAFEMALWLWLFGCTDRQ
jgi:hypothetical protein